MPVYTSYLPPSEYGIVNSMTVLGSVIGILLTLGIDRGAYRLYYDYNIEERKVYLGTLMIGVLSTSALFTFIFLLIPETISFVYKSIPFFPYYSIMLFSTVLSKIIIVPSLYLRISEKASTFFFLSSSNFFLTTILNLIFIVGLNEGAIGMLKGGLFATVLIAPFYLGSTYKAIKFKFMPKYFLESIKFSAPLLPGLLFAWVLNLSDRVFLERYLTLKEVGIYSLGYKIASLILIISGGFFSAYTPNFYKLASEGGENSRKTLKKYNDTIIILFLAGSFIIVLFVKDIFDLFVPLKYIGALQVIPILVIGILFSQITGFLNLMIYQEKKSIQIMYLTFVGALINVSSNFLLIPILGMMGAAYATCITFILLFIIEYQFAKKGFFIPFNWKVFIPLFISLALIFLIINKIEFPNTLLSVSVKFTIIILFMAILMKKYLPQIKSILRR